ncbi:TPA: AAA family ATPase [Yersinia enterocolitica]|uniref:AAA family ATPase n=1 Tax=Yersinia enterocolitica TaxID=630 RepID=UPI003312A420|nr:AAA family ATPase [Yersinia enterocolitica]HDL7801274.1 AAA family ATPase [Yersinia enterocolitica]
MLTSLGVKNLRSFTSRANFLIKPITVFVGKNSSGKSSLLRVFPLMRQSFEANTTGPILWYGRLVDFGDFEEAISKGTKNKNISFYFGLKINEYRTRRTTSGRYIDDDFGIENKEIEVNVELVVSSLDKKSLTKEIIIKVEDTTLKLIFNEDATKATFVASNTGFTYKKNLTLQQNSTKFLPNIASLESFDLEYDDLKNSDDPLKWATGRGHLQSKAIMGQRRFLQELASDAAVAIKDYFHKNTNLGTISPSIRGFRFVSKKNITSTLKYVFAEQKHFINNMNDNQLSDVIAETLQSILLIKNYNILADNINESLKNSFESIKYLAPIRASTERFYRFQDLQVIEMDHTGSNLAMILNSFSNEVNNNFQTWIKQNFGFNVTIEKAGGHYAIMIKNENDDTNHNISDMGFGYSQVLPIILSIWLETQKNNKDNIETIFVIEQPELHLHPAYQTKLAVLFAKIIELSKENSSNIKIIFETHSQQMVDAFGDCIENSEINFNKEDVSILIFDKKNETGTSIDEASFDDQGYFENWPIGFFSGK